MRKLDESKKRVLVPISLVALLLVLGFAIVAMRKQGVRTQDQTSLPFKVPQNSGLLTGIGNRKPNFVVIVLDDADSAMFSKSSLQELFPNIGRIAAEGIQFTNCHVSTPICAPSRASFLRGQYASRTGVRVNEPAHPLANGFSGSYSEYKRLRMEEDDLSVWLKKLGYRTMLVGKYLHNNFDFKVPAGWDEFYCSLGNKYYGTPRFTTATTPTGDGSTLAEQQYRTLIEADDVVRLIGQHGSANAQPFFLYVAPMAPHDPITAGERVERQYRELWPNLEFQITSDVNEQDVRDKPSQVSKLVAANANEIRAAQVIYRERMLSVKSVDDMVGRIYSALKSSNQLANTYIIFTSDHGFLLGQHRIFGKCAPYTRATSVPLIVRGPGVAHAAVAEHLIAQFDVAPTLVDLAGGTPPSFVDGKSFASLLAEPSRNDAKTWRSPILIEHWESLNSHESQVHTAYAGLRTYDQLYVEWANGEVEYYDLRSDPMELENRAASLDAEVKAKFRATMKDVHRVDSAPLATVMPPHYAKPAQIGPGDNIQGMAEADGGVHAVSVVIRDTESNGFWNGDSWQATPLKIAAQVACPDGLLTSWTYAPRFAPAGLLATRSIEVQAIAEDRNARESLPSRSEKIYLDYAHPVTRLIKPVNGAKFIKQTRIVGVSNDNFGVVEVQLLLRELNSRTYWDGQIWTESASRIKLKPAKNGRWHWFPSLPKGRYCVWAFSVDAVGNTDVSPATATFEVQ